MLIYLHIPAHLVGDKVVVVERQADHRRHVDALPQFDHPLHVPAVDSAAIVLVSILNTHHNLSQAFLRGCTAADDISARHDMVRVPTAALGHPGDILHTCDLLELHLLLQSQGNRFRRRVRLVDNAVVHGSDGSRINCCSGMYGEEGFFHHTSNFFDPLATVFVFSQTKDIVPFV